MRRWNSSGRPRTVQAETWVVEPMEITGFLDARYRPAQFYLDVQPITEVVVKAKRILGFQPTPFDAGLKETYRWYLRNTKKTRIDYSFEDRLIEIVHRVLHPHDNRAA